jgi:predicted enzyme related to lactoylglutathione lyase
MEAAMPVELGYMTIAVPSVQLAKAFYGPLFGWNFLETGENAAHIDNTRLPLGFSAGSPADYSKLYFQVTDIGAATAHVIALGGSADEIGESPSGQHATCSDNQGTRFSLWQPAPGFAT